MQFRITESGIAVEYAIASWAESKPRDLGSDRGYRVATAAILRFAQDENAAEGAAFSKNLFLVAQVTERSNVGDDECYSKLIVGAYLT